MKPHTKTCILIFSCLLLSYLIFYVAGVRYTWLISRDFPNSTDGFFYLQELKYRLVSGQGYYFKHSPFFSQWAAVGSILSMNELQLHNLIFISSLIIFCAAIIIHSFAINKFVAVLSLILMYFASDLLFYRHYAFLKQGFSISLFYLGLAITSVNYNARQWKKYSGLLIILYSSLMHIFASALAVIYLLFFIASKIKDKIILSAICLISLGIFSFTLYARPKYLFYLNSPADSAWWGTCRILNCSQFEWQEFIIYSVLALILIFISVINKNLIKSKISLACLFIILLLNAPIWTEQGDMMLRLSVSSVWIFFILFADIIKTKLHITDAVIFIFSLIIFSCFIYSAKKPYSGNRLPYNQINQHSAKLKSWIPADSIILADHGYQFVMTYFLERRSSDKFPKNESTSNFYKLSHREIYEVPLSECRSIETEFDAIQDISCILLDNNWSIHRLSGRK